MDRGKEEVVGAHYRRQFYAFRQVFARFFQESVDILVHLRGIRSGSLKDHAGNTGMAVHTAVVGVAFFAHLDVGDGLQLQYFAVLRRTDHDFAEFFGCDQTAFILHGVLVGFVRIFAERSGCRFDVLLGQHLRHVRRDQLILGHHIRFHPYTHTVVAAHDHHVADPLYTEDVRLQVDADVIGEELLVVRIVRAVE